MTEIDPTIQAIREAWTASRPQLEANDQIVKAALPGCSLPQVDESLETLLDLVGRSRAPSGFKPIYPIARIHLAAAISQLNQQAQNLRGNPTGHFPAFVSQLVACFSPLAAMSIFSESKDQEKQVAGTAADLSQHLALMQTAQRELTTKLSLIEEAQRVTERITALGQQAEEKAAAWEVTSTTIASHAETAAASLEAIEADETIVDEYKTGIETLKTEAQAIAKSLTQHSSNLEALTKKAKEQQDLITDLLPKGASVGLASSFKQQGDRFFWAQIIWGVLFIGGLISLACFSWSIKDNLPTAAVTEQWQYLLFRIPLVSPLVWLSWFSAIQYGNVLRLKEDYAFKEATSNAFAGYRDHMEHLKGISEEDGENAMSRLALVTISILGNEPLRLLQKQGQDASPLERLTSLIPNNKEPKT